MTPHFASSSRITLLESKSYSTTRSSSLQPLRRRRIFSLHVIGLFTIIFCTQSEAFLFGGTSSPQSRSIASSLLSSTVFAKNDNNISYDSATSTTISFPSSLELNSDNTPANNNDTTVVPNDRPHNVAFVAPLLEYGYPPAVQDLQITQFHRQKSKNQQSDDKDENDSDPPLKPILLYLPGFDGTYICPFLQFPELGTEFEVWCMTVGMNDRSTYKELKAIVLDFIYFHLSRDVMDHSNPYDNNQDIPESTESTETILLSLSSNTTTLNNNQTASGGIIGGNFFASWFGSIGSSSPFQKKNQRRRRKEVRPIYLAGESFGGILASDIALTLLTEGRDHVNHRNNPGGMGSYNESARNLKHGMVNLQGLVLINPATCYDRSQLASKGPQVANMPKALYLMGLFSQLIPLFTDEYSVEQLNLILRAKALPSVIDNPQREAYMGRVAFSLPTKLEFMPPSTLSWRLHEWLQTGCSILRDASFQSFPKFRTLLVVGENDKTLPSIAEAERLSNKVLLPRQTHIHVVEGAGHASTCGSRLDLAAVMRKRFVELQTTSKDDSSSSRFRADTDEDGRKHGKRISMKSTAQNGTGPFFGMEPRYDHAKIGLNPIKYWSKRNYRKVQSKVKEITVREPESNRACTYRKIDYTVPT